jgi:hypothetical protein
MLLVKECRIVKCILSQIVLTRDNPRPMDSEEEVSFLNLSNRVSEVPAIGLPVFEIIN